MPIRPALLELDHIPEGIIPVAHSYVSTYPFAAALSTPSSRHREYQPQAQHYIILLSSHVSLLYAQLCLKRHKSERLANHGPSDNFSQALRRSNVTKEATPRLASVLGRREELYLGLVRKKLSASPIVSTFGASSRACAAANPTMSLCSTVSPHEEAAGKLLGV